MRRDVLLDNVCAVTPRPEVILVLWGQLTWEQSQHCSLKIADGKTMNLVPWLCHWINDSVCSFLRDKTSSLIVPGRCHFKHYINDNWRKSFIHNKLCNILPPNKIWLVVFQNAWRARDTFFITVITEAHSIHNLICGVPFKIIEVINRKIYNTNYIETGGKKKCGNGQSSLPIDFLLWGLNIHSFFKE